MLSKLGMPFSQMPGSSPKDFMLDRLSPQFRLLAKSLPASEDQIRLLQSRFAPVPAQFIELIREATEIEIQHESGIYLRFWGPLGCIEMDEAYGVSGRMAGAFPIGDDGGGRVILYLDGKKGSGLYTVGYGDLDADDAIYVASSLGELLVEAKGIEVF